MQEEAFQFVALFAVAVLAGIVNSVAGGGTLLTFPALHWAGHSEVVANTTSTVSLVPGSLGSAGAYRRELWECRKLTALLIGPSLIGGVVGSLLLTRLEEKYFAAVVPWLILAAVVLFLLQPLVSRVASAALNRPLPSSTVIVFLTVAQFFLAIYGGYFGAGMGIVMLAGLSLMGVGDIHRMNAIKSFLAMGINGAAAIVFVLERKVDWRHALTMAIGATVGGYLGAHVARQLNRDLVRWVVIVIGLGLAAWFFSRQA